MACAAMNAALVKQVYAETVLQMIDAATKMGLTDDQVKHLTDAVRKVGKNSFQFEFKSTEHLLTWHEAASYETELAFWEMLENDDDPPDECYEMAKNMTAPDETARMLEEAQIRLAEFENDGKTDSLS